jgi:tRNA pseudouridine38-40 synthase
LAYDGSPFAGWAVQPGERTVEGELRAALATVLREPVKLTVAGRTDTGVHALGQVVSYEGELPRLRSVNALLPPEIAVLSAERAPDGFSARHDARSRSYRYRILAA